MTFTGRGSRVCPRCGQWMEAQRPPKPGRPRRWCSPECRRAASEERRAAESGAIAIRYIKPDVLIEDHVRAVLGSPAACRPVLRELGERAARGELLDSRWTSVLSDLEHLRQPQNRTLGGARRGR